MRPIWFDTTDNSVKIIDQRKLPHIMAIEKLESVLQVITAIKDMYVRGAPLIGATAAYGVYIAAKNISSDCKDKEAYLSAECKKLQDARPTAVNLIWAVERVFTKLNFSADIKDIIDVAKKEADAIAEEEVENCRKIGEYGLPLIEEISKKRNGKTVNILTHCNAGRLACVEYGTATAPIYAAFDKGIDLHVWVDETRPLNQGARLTAYELEEKGVKHTVITDNAGGHLMQHSLVDIVIVGTDRTAYTGDVANKIGTYLKALAAKDNNIPFYVALPSSTFDWEIEDGIKDIPIEKREPDEIRYVEGFFSGKIEKVAIMPKKSPAANYAFDVTPARLVTGFITERGICKANKESVLSLFPEKDRSKNYG
ncbi:MAG: S-methyl-5-thioribose-1-phosphate isomerase [Deltaproteobacteria bacterium]|nr:S-methyl-5-thioribose-1-phosphate isomerase [Deltaproteobacteria bacterium]